MKYQYIIAFAVAISLIGCSNNKENEQARSLLTQAQEAFKSGNFTVAAYNLDSLQKSFPQEVKLQREAMSLRPQIIEAESMFKIDSIDTAYNSDIEKLKMLKPQLKWIKTPGMVEGYWIAPGAYNPNFMNTTGIEARVSEIGEFYIVSSANPSAGLKHTSVTLRTACGQADTPAIAYDGESNYRINGGEVITFSPAQSDSIGALALKTAEAKQTSGASVILKGNNGKRDIKLTAKQLDGIAKAYEYSMITIRARDSQVERERLMRTIEIAKRQLANLSEKE